MICSGDAFWIILTIFLWMLQLQGLKEESAQLLELRGKYLSLLSAKEIERRCGKYGESDVEKCKNMELWRRCGIAWYSSVRWACNHIADRQKSCLLVPGSKTKSLYPISTQGKSRNSLGWRSPRLQKIYCHITEPVQHNVVSCSWHDHMGTQESMSALGCCTLQCGWYLSQGCDPFFLHCWS